MNGKNQTTRHLLRPDSSGARIVEEEEELLARVSATLAGRLRPAGRQNIDYDAELVALRDEVAEAKPEDVAPLIEQMTRVAALAASRHVEGEALIDPAAPYFAHLRLRREAAPGALSAEQDILIGRRGFIDRAAGVHIVDWRDAPVSQVYYRYDEGDDYDEQVGTRRLSGIVEARRNVLIQLGTLRRIGCPQGVYVRDPEGRWHEAEGTAAPTLAGGQGKAARPPRAAPPRRGLGVHGGPVPRADKHLPEIAALIDREQFDLITQPSAGLIVIQGGAGSGKTTVALHRVAYLTFHDPQHFRPGRCLVVVPTLSLQRYVAGVLPALGVRGVPVVTVREWMRSARRRVLPNLPSRDTEETPPSVARVKKHPALLAVLDRYVVDLADTIGESLAASTRDGASRAEVRAAWAWTGPRPPVERLREMRRWLASSGLASLEVQRLELELGRARRKAGDVLAAWGEVLTDFARLRQDLPSAGPEAVRDGELHDVLRWTAAQQEDDPEEELEGIDPEARTPVDGGALDESEHGLAAGRLDPEDDAILLRLTQLLRGGLYRSSPEQELLYHHLAIDEAQDLSAIEIKVLLDCAGERRSVTLAGDVAQRLVFDNGFQGWNALLGVIGESAVPLRPLQLSYRSTEEVMAFARAVMGPLAPEETPARPGAPVELHRFAAMGEAVGFLAESLRSLSAREPTASVALLTRHPAQADAYFHALARAEVPCLRRVRRHDFTFTPGVDVTDVTQVKGLEFDYVIILDADGANYPSSLEARHLLHIAATRAAHQLWLTCVGRPSPLLPAGMDEAGGE